MTSDRAWYWVAAGVLALGLTNAYQDGQFDWVHQFSDRSAAVAARYVEKGSRLVEAADVVLGHDSPILNRTQAYLLRMEARLDCNRIEHAQEELAGAEQRLSAAQLASAQTQLERLQSRIEAGRVMVENRFCPRSRHFAVVPATPSMDVPPIPFPETSIDISEITPEVNIPVVHVPAVVVPQVVLPRVVIPAVLVPPVRVEMSDPDSDGLI
ncbi:MAG TPA: hypothetical protein VEI01_18720 [Terriglobales bacterium]|nr:hypothetical protein [Terriglobales bacterium]